MAGITAQRMAWIARMLQEMNANAGEAWHDLETLTVLEVDGTAEIMGDGFAQSRRIRLGRALAACRGVEAVGFVLEGKRDHHTHALLYRAMPARSPTASPASVGYGDARRELAELREEVIAWQRAGEGLRERMAVLEERIRRA